MGEREGEKNSGVRLCVAGTDKRRVLSLACLLLIIWYMCYQFIIEDTIEGIIRFGRLCGSENAVFSVGFVAYFFFFGKYKMIFDEMFFFVIFFLMIFLTICRDLMGNEILCIFVINFIVGK